MNSRVSILEELKGISSAVANLEYQNVFKVPEGYFDDLAMNIILRIRKMEEQSFSQEKGSGDSSLDRLEKMNPFRVQEGYFDSLAGSIIQKIRKQENESSVGSEVAGLSPLLAGLRNKNVFSVPEGYFENLSQDLINSIALRQEARVVPFTKRKRNWIYFAAAAAVAGFIGLSALFNALRWNQAQTPVAVVTPIAPQSEPLKDIPAVSDEALSNFLNNTLDIEGAGLDSQDNINGLALLNLDDNSIAAVLKETSDNEFMEYLNDNPLTGNASLVTN